jgi:hypothetical protein
MDEGESERQEDDECELRIPATARGAKLGSRLATA